MNRKLIAAAVAASVVAPVAAYGGEVAVYGNLTNALAFESVDDQANPNDSTKDYSTTDVSTVGSRLGVKVSSDLGNGLTTSGQYEFATQSDNDDAPFGSTRVATVGLSGGFGSVNVGQQWSTFYNTIGSFVSPNYTVSVGVGGSFRTGNTIKYTNSFGPINLGVDIRVDDDEGGGQDAQGDGFGIGVIFHPTDNISVGIAYDDSDGADTGKAGAVETAAAVAVVSAGTVAGTAATPYVPPVAPTQDGPDSEIVGIAAKATFGNFWGSVGYQSQETDSVDAIAATGMAATFIPGAAAKGEVETDWYQVWVGTNLGEKTSLAIGYGEVETETDGNPNDEETEHFAIAVNHDMGGGLHFFLEFQDSSTETDGMEKDVDTTKTFLGMRLNF